MLPSRLSLRSRACVSIGTLSLCACSPNASSEQTAVGGSQAIGGNSALSTGGGTPSIQAGGTAATVPGSTALGATAGTTGSASPLGGATSTMGGASVAGGMNHTGGTTLSPATGGTTNTTSMAGSTANATGGTGGLATGGTQGSGGTSAATTTGGSSAVPMGLPSTCGTTNCDNAAATNPQLTSYGALGNVTMYSKAASNGGACLYGATSILYYGAINVNLTPGDAKGQWQGGSICGQCFEVTVVTSQGYKSVVVRVTDKCADGQCGLDLGGSAPTAVMVDGVGRYQGAWRAVSCLGHPEVSDGVPSIHVKDGSSSGWSVIQVRNPNMAVAGIDYKDSTNSVVAGTMAKVSGIENYHQVPLTLLSASSPIELTVHYVDGSSAKVSLTSAQLATADATYPMN